MKTKTSTLTGPALDWTVWYLAGGVDAYPKLKGNAFLRAWRGNSSKYLNPSTEWAQGGPIIEREKITLDVHDNTGEWSASIYRRGDDEIIGGKGRTALIAAMRCLVAARLGDEVEVPEELLP